MNLSFSVDTSTNKSRFDFTDEWKIIKLGQITNINTGKKDVKDKKDDGKYPFLLGLKKLKELIHILLMVKLF